MVKKKIDHLIKYLLKLYLAKFFSCNNEQYSRQNLDTAINSGFDWRMKQQLGSWVVWYW